MKHIFVVSFLFSLLSCSEHLSDEVCEFDIPKDSIRDGDLVFRLGRSVESSLVQQAGNGFSHVGMLVWVADTLKVVHAVPKEKNDSMVFEPIERFLSQAKAQKAGFYKVECPDSIAKSASEYALKRYEEGCMFDHMYDLEDETKMYCTELVWRAYNEFGVDISGEKRTPVMKIIAESGEIITPYDLVETLKEIK